MPHQQERQLVLVVGTGSCKEGDATDGKRKIEWLVMTFALLYTVGLLVMAGRWGEAWRSHQASEGQNEGKCCT